MKSPGTSARFVGLPAAVCVLCTWPIVLLSLAQDAPTSAPAQRPGYRDRYGVLTEHNIFLRERSRPVRAPATRPLSPEQTFVLTGIVLEEGENRAYFEDRARGGIVRISAGDAVANGRITQIDIDAVAYEQVGQQTWITIGSDLTGSTPVVIQQAGAAAPTTAPDPNAPNLTAEERMRARRMQELNRR